MVETTPVRHLLIPFAGRGSPACRAALPGLRLPRLEALLARLASAGTDTQDDTAFSPPHERALAAALGLQAADGCIPWAARDARRLGLPGSDGDTAWGWIDLCNWQVDVSDVVLGDPAQTHLEAAESQALLDAARPLFEEDGIGLHVTPEPGRWLASGELFRALPTASLDRAIGHSIAQWSHITDAGRPLRRLQNEVQMLLYTERVNDQRTARGLPPINSFWLSGTGALPASVQPDGAGPAIVDALRDAALHDDGDAWAAAWQAIDAGPVAELLATCEGGADVALTLCGDSAAQRFSVQQRGFSGWVKRTFGSRPRAAAVLEAL
ncbi:hypothetical protein [Variovorax sp. dw_308]|uniref:hypothetical protein n=1 Tax=Variovorax sp. dw_308 TaxID=2721546 RepID=UPI001C46DCFD|nr:hypothetical protein [Variovorax sp. dw_308]